MPRAKSEITGAHTIGVRISLEEYDVYKKLGGGPWLRSYLKDIATRRKEDAQANSAHARPTERMVAVRSAGPTALSKSQTQHLR